MLHCYLLQDSQDPQTHAIYVWDKFISKCQAQFVAIVAHSAGGYVTVRLVPEICILSLDDVVWWNIYWSMFQAAEKPNDFMHYVFAVAFTDSVHSMASYTPVWPHLLKVKKNCIIYAQLDFSNRFLSINLKHKQICNLGFA